MGKDKEFRLHIELHMVTYDPLRNSTLYSRKKGKDMAFKNFRQTTKSAGNYRFKAWILEYVLKVQPYSSVTLPPLCIHLACYLRGMKETWCWCNQS